MPVKIGLRTWREQAVGDQRGLLALVDADPPRRSHLGLGDEHQRHPGDREHEARDARGG
jgi:hypothetical protein